MTRVPLRWAPSGQARALLGAAAVALAFAVLLRRPELLALATPALWALLTTPRTAEPGTLLFDAGPEELRAEEGVPRSLRVDLVLDRPVPALRAALALPAELADTALRAEAHRAARLDLTAEVTARRWGRHRAGPLRLDLLGAGGLRAATAVVPLSLDLLVLPAPLPVRTASAPRLLPDRVGEHVTRAAGPGVEPVAVRPFATGDAVRRVNWRVSSRRPQLHVTVPAAERSVDLVLVVDALSDVGTAPDTSLDRAVRTASGLAVRWLRDRDRVGLVVLGSTLRWLTPATGRVQQQRVAEQVLRAWAPPGQVPPQVDRVPRAALPPGAVVVLVSPLLDDRALDAVAALRERSRRLLVVDVLAGVEPQVDRRDPTGALALRLWRLERAALVHRLRTLGTPVLQPAEGGLDRLVALALRAPR